MGINAARRTPVPRLPLALVLLAAPAAALSPARGFVTDSGYAFIEVPGPLSELRSTGPILYRIGAAGAPVTGVETVLLRPDCTAKSALVGEGGWMAQPDGLTVLLVEGAGLYFPDQEPPWELAGLCDRP